MHPATDPDRYQYEFTENDELTRFVAELGDVMKHVLNLDRCEITLTDNPDAVTGLIDNAPIRLPLQTDGVVVGWLTGSRKDPVLSERESKVIPDKLRIAAERINLIRKGSWPFNPKDENTSPFERARHERDQFEALLRAQQAVARQQDTDATLNAIVQELERILNVTTAHVYIVDLDAGVLHNRVSRISGHAFGEHFREIPIGAGVIGSAIQTGEASYFPNAHLDPRSHYPPDVEPMIRLLGESVMVAPLYSGERVAGVLFVNRLGHDHFTEHDFQLFRLFVGQIESVFDKALRLEIERRQRTSAEALAALALRVANVETEAELARAAAEMAIELSGAPEVAVVVRQMADSSTLEAVVRTGEEPVVTVSDSPAACDARSRGNGQSVDSLSPSNTRAPFLQPIMLRGGDSWLGAIWIAQRENATARTSSSEYLDSLAGIVAMTLERIRAASRAGELERTIGVLSRSSRIALEAQDDERAIDELVTLLDEFISARAISGWLNDSRQDSESEPTLRLASFRGDPALRRYSASLGITRQIMERARFLSERVLVLSDLSLIELKHLTRRQLQSNGIESIVALVLADNQNVYGMVRIDCASSDQLPSRQRLRLATAVVDQFSLGLGAIRTREESNGLYRSSVEALAATVDAKDPFTHQHSRNVAFYSRLIAERLGLSEDEAHKIELAGLLHDIGKISIADRILTKTDPLDAHERMEMMSHPVRGAQILTGETGLDALVPIVRHHHERHDGLGYPDGLSGDSVPLGAAIVAVADAVDTMLNDRSYADRLSVAEVQEELRSGSGTQFHPDVAVEFLKLIEHQPELLRLRDVSDLTPAALAGARDHLPVADVAQIRIISRLAQELNALTDLRTFVHGACRIVVEELGYEHVEIVLDERRPDSLSTGNGRAIINSPGSEVVCRLAMEQNKVLNIPDLSDIAEFEGTRGSALAVPLQVEGKLIGALCVSSERKRAFSIVDEALMTVAANQLAVGLNVAQLHDQIKWTARHDALTQALNHGAFYDELASAIAHHSDTGEPVSLILCDVEGLKAINDQLGHLTGDSLLRMLVRRIRANVRDQDLIARYGGDEFAVITYGTTRNEAIELTKKLLESLRQEPLLGTGTRTQVTTGIAQVGEDAMSPSELVRIADDRLYSLRGKRASKYASSTD